MLPKLIFLSYVALRAFFVNAILIAVGIETPIEAAIRVTVILIVRPKAVVFVQHVVDLHLCRPAFPYLLRLLRADSVYTFRSGIIGQRVVLQRFTVSVTTRPE